MSHLRERVLGLASLVHHVIRRPFRGAIRANVIPSTITDLPIVPVVGRRPAQPMLAVFLSGDGGWASLPHGVSVHLADRGVPVLGLNVRRYFRRRRTAEELGGDLARMLQARTDTHDGFVLIGFSFGAGALPFAVDALDPDLRARIRLLALLSPIEDAEFKFSWWDWLRFDVLGLSVVPSLGAAKVAPMLKALLDVDQLMVFGSDELAGRPPWGAAHASRVVVRGGHHLGHRYREIASLILTALGSRANESDRLESRGDHRPVESDQPAGRG